MSIGNTLSNALSGLTAASRRAEVTSHNLANATTEGYARQRVESDQRVTAGRGAGVELSATKRSGDARLTANRRSADAELASDAELAKAGRSLADAIGGPDDPGSLFARIAHLETSFRAISENPTSVAFQERGVTAAASVVTAFNGAAEAIDTIRTDADREIATAVSEVNTALNDIADLNIEISMANVRGNDAAAFEQQRDFALDKIASHLPIRITQRENGQIAVLSDQGVTLLDGKARELSFEPTNIVTADMDYRSGGSPLSGLTVDGLNIEPRSSLQSIDTGRLAGLFETRDGFPQSTIQELDALAEDLASRFEVPGIADGSGRGLFTDAGSALAASPAIGLASRFALSDRVDPDQGGAAWRLRDGLSAATPGPTGSSVYSNALLDAMTNPGSAAVKASELSSVFERRGQSFENAVAASQTKLTTFKNAETAVTGVDVDQELQELILIEQSYAANARVIEVADRMVQRLLEI